MTGTDAQSKIDHIRKKRENPDEGPLSRWKQINQQLKDYVHKRDILQYPPLLYAFITVDVP